MVDDDSDQSSDDEIVEGDFVITKVDSKKARSPRLLYIARVDVIDDEGYEGLFFRKVQSQSCTAAVAEWLALRTR